MVQPFTTATAALKPGEYSGKPVQTQFGWHIILLEDTRETQPPALTDVTSELTRTLRQDAVKDYVAELRDKTDLELNSNLIRVIGKDEAKPAAAE